MSFEHDELKELVRAYLDAQIQATRTRERLERYPDSEFFQLAYQHSKDALAYYENELEKRVSA